MEFNGFTDKANDALNCALTCAMSMGHTYVGSEHILTACAAVTAVWLIRYFAKAE